ncbi:MAG: deoxyguanosinetriphosphate triphosphohydrolase [Planctomycetota bacterium]|nr:deoxyguanosinetriphosphate triphosphohydrolase [Planctomycetota bacterium]
MNWARLLSAKRFRSSHGNTRSQDTESGDKQNGRSQFEKDLDRITFSSSFRRLGRKTQVHLLSENDQIHTRLSHSLEVACVGRSLGTKVGHWLKTREEGSLPNGFLYSTVGEIVQAACLAHDIGNPPFGHAAEDAIREWFKERLGSGPEWQERLTEGEITDLQDFDGNAMAFRVVTYKEFHVGQGGMRLTYPTLGALLKYPWTSHFARSRKNKFSCFQTEYDHLCEVAAGLGLVEKEQQRSERKAEYARHPLAYLVEAADDICYRVLDIEDAIELRLLSETILYDQFHQLLDADLSDEQRHLLGDSSISPHTKNGLVRGKMVDRMIAEVVAAFKEHYETIMEGRFEGSLFDKAHGDSICSAVANLYGKEALCRTIYQNQRNVCLELGVYSVLHTLLETSVDAACELVDGTKRSYKTEIIQRFFKYNHATQAGRKDLYQVLMPFLDYITGMTDEYATFVNKQLLGLGN